MNWCTDCLPTPRCEDEPGGGGDAAVARIQAPFSAEGGRAAMDGGGGRVGGAGRGLTCRSWPKKKLALDRRGLTRGSLVESGSSGCRVFWNQYTRLLDPRAPQDT